MQHQATQREQSESALVLLSGKLLETALKIRAIGYVLEHQRPEEVTRLDGEEISTGLGRLIQQQGEEVQEAAIQLDQWVTRRSQVQEGCAS